MPYMKAEKPFTCSTCGKRKREGYRNPTTGRWDARCADCSRAYSAARKAKREATKQTSKATAPKRTRGGKGRTPQTAA